MQVTFLSFYTFLAIAGSEGPGRCDYLKFHSCCAANIIVNDKTGKVTLIDFEYGSLNYRAFDIANHFNEWAGGTDNGTPDYSKFPTPGQQRNFCEAYLLQLGEDVVGGVVTEAALAKLMREANFFVQVNHWYWGCWAVNQARTEGSADFPYLTYATSRLTQYKAAQVV